MKKEYTLTFGSIAKDDNQTITSSSLRPLTLMASAMVSFFLAHEPLKDDRDSPASGLKNWKLDKHCTGRGWTSSWHYVNLEQKL